MSARTGRPMPALLKTPFYVPVIDGQRREDLGLFRREEEAHLRGIRYCHHVGGLINAIVDTEKAYLSERPKR